MEGLSDDAKFVLVLIGAILFLVLFGASKDDPCAKWPEHERPTCYEMQQDEADYYNSSP